MAAGPLSRFVLGAAYTSRPRQNGRVGTDLVTTEVLGLQTALARAPVELALDLRRLNGDLLPPGHGVSCRVGGTAGLAGARPARRAWMARFHRRCTDAPGEPRPP